MSRLISRLPPLKALLAFEAVGRLGTVTRAAQELGSTQPAVSHQLKNLEQFLGITLFSRSARALSLTTQGRDYHAAITGHLNAVATATDQLRDTANKTVEILSHPAFTSLCLMPLTQSIREAIPGINIKLTAREVFTPQQISQADIVIEYGKTDAASAPLLLTESVVPVVSPDFLARYELNTNPLDAATLNRLPVLELDDGSFWMDWPQWRAMHHLQADPQDISIYSNYALVIEGARNGQGVALGFTALISQLLEQRQLIPLGPVMDVADYGYSLKLNRADNPSARQLSDWLMAHFA